MGRYNDENAFFAELEKNIADEAEAREGYYKILNEYGDLLSSQEEYNIRLIISEELKHTNILNTMIQRRNGIVAEI